MYKEHLTQKSPLNQAAFCWTTCQICTTLNMLQNLCGSLVLMWSWNPTEMTGFHPWKWLLAYYVKVNIDCERGKHILYIHTCHRTIHTFLPLMAKHLGLTVTQIPKNTKIITSGAHKYPWQYTTINTLELLAVYGVVKATERERRTCVVVQTQIPILMGIQTLCV